MSIRGVDTQLMVNRTLDLAKDVSAMQRREQVAQDQFAQQLQAMTAEKSSQVQDVQETEGGKIQNEEKEKGQQQERSAKKKKGLVELRDENQDPMLDASLKPGEDDSGMRIDIRV